MPHVDRSGRLEAGELWWKNAVVYCLDVETYRDSDGDGIGDLPGLTDSLDHIAALGATCIWLLPLHPSPNQDDGYDVSDFYAVDPRLGTLGDFVTFRRAAAERGIRVLLDLVVNHTSDQHPWFQESRSSRDARRRDWYVWADEPNPDVTHVIFPGKQEGNWTFDEGSDQWYFHRFLSHQPDLNMANPEVRAELKQVMGFWLELGASGFRIDAVPFLIESITDEEEPGREHHEWLEEMRSFVSRRRGDAILVGEANIPEQEMVRYFGDSDEVHLLFGYGQNAALLASLARHDGGPLREQLRDLPRVPHPCGWLTFARIHDEANLERLSPDDRDLVFDRFAPEDSMRIYGRGMRPRIPRMVGWDRARLELVYALTFSVPGTPVLLYGEEIAMGDNLRLPGRMSVRTPMQWSSDAAGGFSAAAPGDLVRPFASPPGGPDDANVDDQRGDEGSFLQWMTRLVAARRSTRAIGLGPVTVLDLERSDVVGWRFDWQEECVICVHNLAAEPRTVEVADLDSFEGKAHVQVLLSSSPPGDDPVGTSVELAPLAYRWWKVSPR